MRRKKPGAAWIWGLLLLIAGPPVAEPEDRRTPPSAAEEALTIVLPKGDPRAGREAFRELGCGVCHAVAGEDDSPPQVDRPAPALGRVQAKLKPGEIATAIVSPSHDISPEALPALEGEVSPMADLSAILTVRQLVDLVAYVRSLDGP